MLFGRDLRLEDHTALAEAARFGEVVPALILDRATLARVARSPRRAAYYAAAVDALAASLRARGTRLVVRRGPLVATARRLARDAGAATVVWSAAYDAETAGAQRRLQSGLEEAGLRAIGVHDAPAVSPEETAAARSSDGGRGYRALGPYLAAWATARRAPVAAAVRFSGLELAGDALPHAAEFGASPSDAEVSETATLAEFDRYLAGHALQYLAARNVPFGTPTARLSAPLSFGVVGARALLARVDERLRDPFLLAEERRSLHALMRSLAQRDFFLQLAWFFETAPDAVLQERLRSFPLARTHPALDAWRSGRTGYALVDAGQRELLETGWMHPRVRLVAASFLCFDLGVDWRVGRDAWDRHLIEDDPALAWGNWQWVAGLGADLAQFPRIYNPARQLRSFDPRGLYVRRWLPELAGVSDADLFDPAGAAERAQLTLPLFDGALMRPVVEHGAAARAYLKRYAAFVRPRAAAGT